MSCRGWPSRQGRDHGVLTHRSPATATTTVVNIRRKETQLGPGGELAIYPNSGHGGIFQYHDKFVPIAGEFLNG